MSESRPSVVVLAPHAPGEGFGGAERHLADLAQVLTALGAEVSFLDRRDAHLPVWLQRGLQRVSPLLLSAVAGRRLARAASVRAADVVLSVELMGIGVRHSRHLHLFFGSYAGFRETALARATGWKRLLRKAVTLCAAALERRTVGSLGAVANSEGLQMSLRRARVPTLRQVLLPPTDLQHFQPGAQREARERLGLPCDAAAFPRILLFAGRWEYAKGADRVERLLAVLPRDWILVIAAPSAAGRDWPARAIVLNDVPYQQMPDLYRAADALMQPSRFEGYSLVVSEAQACGCPVLSTDVGQGAHLRAAGGKVADGLVDDPDSPDAWLGALLRVAGDESVLRASRHEARHFAERHVSHAAVAHQWASLLSRIAPEIPWKLPA